MLFKDPRDAAVLCKCTRFVEGQPIILKSILYYDIQTDAEKCSQCGRAKNCFSSISSKSESISRLLCLNEK